MKLLFRQILALGLIALTFAGCKKEDFQEVREPSIQISKDKDGNLHYAISPLTDEAGSTRAYPTDEVTAKGFNLNKVSRVTFDGVEAKITQCTIGEVKFAIPVLPLPQMDEPQKVELLVYGNGNDNPFFRYEYFVTVPVTEVRIADFAPKTGTAGTEITVSGRNLEQVAGVRFGSVEVKAETFLEHAASTIKFAAPALDGTEATTYTDIKVIWNGTETDVTSEDEKFAFLRPVFDAYNQTEEAAIGDEITLTGENLDLVKAYKWGEYELLTMEGATKTSVTVKIPSTIEVTDPAICKDKLEAIFGTPARTITIVSEFSINTTPKGPVAPTFSSIKDEDGRYTRTYLGHTMTVTGENMSSVEAFEIDGIRVPVIEGSANDMEAKFTVPSGITGNEVKNVSFKAIYGGGNEADFGQIEVYPFFYTKGLRLGVGASSSTYKDDGRNMSFLMLSQGKVISAEEWVKTNADPFALNAPNSVTGAKNKITGSSKEDYYSVKPYLFLTAGSDEKLALQSPSNSDGQLNKHFYLEGEALKPAIPEKTFGTPILYMRCVTNAEWKDKVVSGTLDNIFFNVVVAGSGAPAFGTAETSSAWVKGSVINIQYHTFAQGQTGDKPGNPATLEGIKSQGFIYITDITCHDKSGNGKADPSHEGYIEFDLFWSNELTED